MGKIKGIIFDLDGTLINTLGDLRTAMNKMLKMYNYKLLSPEEILQNINYGAREFVRRSLPSEFHSDDEMIDKCFATYGDCYRECYIDTTFLYEGIAEAVSLLKSKGYKLAVLSNKQDEQTKALINKLFPKNEFDIIMGQSDLPHKPDPAAAWLIVKQLGLTIDEMLFVGDSHIDMLTAVNSGIFPVGVSWGYRSTDVLIENGAQKIVHKPCEIIDICANL